MLSSTTRWPARRCGAIALGRIRDVAQVRLVILIQRRGHANDDGIHLRQARVVRGRFEPFGAGLLNLIRQDAHDVGSALHQRAHFALIDVEARDPKLLFGVQQRQRQTHIPQADNGNPRLPLLNLVFQLRYRTAADWRNRHLEICLALGNFITPPSIHCGGDLY